MIEICGYAYERIGEQLAARYYSRRKNGVMLMDENRNPRVFVVANRRQGYFAVTCSMTDGGIRYMFGLANSDSAWAGLDLLGESEQASIFQSLAEAK